MFVQKGIVCSNSEKQTINVWVDLTATVRMCCRVEFHRSEALKFFELILSCSGSGPEVPTARSDTFVSSVNHNGQASTH